MKIAISATKPSLDEPMDERFGRCPYFIVVEPDTMKFEAVENLNAALGSGSGVQVARMLSQRAITTVLTGSCGPNAWNTLDAAEIRVVTGCTGSVREVVRQYNSGELSAATGPNVRGHAGEASRMGGAGATTRGAGRGRRRGMGRARGRGMSSERR